MKSGAVKGLFKTFDFYLESQGVVGKAGSIIDASFADVPKQRNYRDENKEIKKGKIP